MRRPMQIAAVLLTIATASTAAQTPKLQGKDPKTETAREASDRVWAACVAALKKSDASTCLSFYTDDAVDMDPGAATAVGKPAIASALKEFLASVSRINDWSHTVDGVSTTGDVAVEHGQYRTVIVEKGKTQPATSDARYVLVWKRQPDGRWLISHDLTIPNPPKATK
jgi:uncharacterized protein (TIGR02246 family)